MSKSSTNLSDRIFLTINYNNGTAYIGELSKGQKILVELSNRELENLILYIQEYIDVDDIREEK
jgi:hypothetical protein